MTHDEIRKLLGGYATNTLTEGERKALFDAALEDQELFNALHEEEALKELLADPVTRAQVRYALEQPDSGKQRAAWRLRWWAWGGAVSAVAAAAIVFAVIRSNEVQTPKPALQMASAGRPASAIVAEGRGSEVKEPAAKPMARRDDRVSTLKKLSAPMRDKEALATTTGSAAVRAKDALASNTPPPSLPEAAPATVIPAPVQAEAQQGQAAQRLATAEQVQIQGQAPAAVNSFRETLASPNVQPQVSPRFGTAVGGSASYTGPLLRYSLLKRDASGMELPVAPETALKAGDLVRLRVSTRVPGNLVLFQLDRAGEWQRVSSTIVLANSNSTVPDTPIRVPDSAERFRLALEPVAGQSPVGGVSGARIAKKALAEARDEKVQGGPLVVEITIGPK